jgi:glycosyltransferase involved in cell wall biosynthesis
MKVALYYPWIYLPGGAERVILGLVQNSQYEWEIFTSRYESESTFPEFRDLKVTQLGTVSVKRTLREVMGAGARILTQKLPLEGFDALVVVSDGVGDFTIFRNSSIPVFCCCLTPLRVAFDSAYRKGALARLNPVHAMVYRVAAACFRQLDRMAWKGYKEVFFISRESARRAAEGGLIRANTATITHPGLGVRGEFVSSRSDPYFLIAGRLMWTKNIELGIRAFRSLLEQNPGLGHFRLVIAGIVDRKSVPYFEYLKTLAAGEERIEFRPFPSDEELRVLYRNCRAVVFTPFNEDWGIVPLEAMSFGKPVVAVNRGGPTESIEHGVQGFLCEPDPEEFALHMGLLASNTDLAERMGTAGILHSRKFTWQAFVAPVDNALEKLSHRVEIRKPLVRGTGAS